MGFKSSSLKMIFKLRLDHDLYHRLILVFFASFSFCFLASYLLYTLAVWVTLVVPLSLMLATLKSSLQVEVGDKSVLITGCDTGFGLALAKHLKVIQLDITKQEDWEKALDFVQ